MAEKVSVQTMYSFNITYDRHKGRYGFRTSDFPDKYTVHDSTLNLAYDPDWQLKLQIKRVKLKKFLFLFGVAFIWLRNRIVKVEEFDRIKRTEQRAMQNTEVEELQNKKVDFVLFDT